MIRRRATLLLGVVGLALLGAAAARVIYPSSGAGIATILAAIADPRSPGEQTQGLELAKACWPQLSKSYRSAIQSVIADNAAGDADTDRRRMAAEVRALPVT